MANDVRKWGESSLISRCFVAGQKMRFIIGIVALASLSLPAARAQQAAPPAGSIYPTDVVPSLAQQGARPSAANDAWRTSVSGENARLAAALGPAGFILNEPGADDGFKSLIRQAVGRHPAYHHQLSALTETRAQRRLAASALYPQLSANFNGGYSLSRKFGSDTQYVVESLQPKEKFSAGLTASQLVFDGGATIQRMKSARAHQSEYENAISARINNLAMDALTAYHDLLTHQALLALGDAYIARYAEILEDVKERERLGAGSRADVARATARLAAARARVSEIRESERLAEVRYEEFFGEKPGALVRPSVSVVSVKTRDEAATAAVVNNPELAVAAAQADASQADYKAAKSARLPELRVSVDASKYDVFKNTDDYDVRAGLDMNYNIFGGGARAATIAQAASRARQAHYNEDEVRQGIERDAAMAFERREGAEAQLRDLATAVIANDTTRELVLERYRVARGDLIDVLQAENDYFEAGVAFLTGLANRDMAAYALMEQTGDLLRDFSPTEEYADQMKGDGNG